MPTHRHPRGVFPLSQSTVTAFVQAQKRAIVFFEPDEPFSAAIVAYFTGRKEDGYAFGVLYSADVAYDPWWTALVRATSGNWLFPDAPQAPSGYYLFIDGKAVRYAKAGIGEPSKMVAEALFGLATIAILDRAPPIDWVKRDKERAAPVIHAFDCATMAHELQKGLSTARAQQSGTQTKVEPASTTSSSTTAPAVIVSYSHDTEAHRSNVLDLTQTLREKEINAWCDRFEPHPTEGWGAWMREKLEHADYVLVVCTKTYRQRFESKAGSTRRARRKSTRGTEPDLKRIQWEFTDELAKVLHEADDAKIIARRAGFPAKHLPEFKTAVTFWSTVVEDATNGKAPW